MVAAVTALESQGFATIVSEATATALASSLFVTSVWQLPAENSLTSQEYATAVVETEATAEASEVYAMVVWRGFTARPEIRAWTFTLDGHDFYVLRLGASETLVYDLYSEHWSVYGTGTDALWRANTGRNWQGGRKHALNKSDVIVGDDRTGALYFLSPEDDTDDDPLTDEAIPFQRYVTGQIVVRPGYASNPCYGVQLFGSIGSPASDDTVTLEISDDLGDTYTSMGDLTLDGSSFTTRAHWRSLGSMVAPGRLFRVTDEGALKRIDGLVMD